MPTVSFTFELPEEQYEFEIASKAIKFISAIDSIKEYLRSLEKYQAYYKDVSTDPPELCDDHKDVPTSIETIRDKVHEILCENECNDL